MNSESNDDDDLNIDNSMNTDHGIKVVNESLRPLSFCERMKNLSSHCLPLKEQFRTLICFYWVHLHEEGTMKNNPTHVESQKHKSVVDRYSRHAVCNMEIVT